MNTLLNGFTDLPEPAEWLTLMAASTVSSLPRPDEREEGERGGLLAGGGTMYT